MKISFLYSKIVNCSKKACLEICLFRHSADMAISSTTAIYFWIVWVNCSLLLKYPKLEKSREHVFETDVFSYVLVWKFKKNSLKPAGEQLVWKSVIAVKFFRIKLNLNITFSMFFILQHFISYCSILLNNSNLVW
jgi:hypothetical protein